MPTKLWQAVASCGARGNRSIDDGGPLRQLVLRSGRMEVGRGKGRFTVGWQPISARLWVFMSLAPVSRPGRFVAKHSYVPV